MRTSGSRGAPRWPACRRSIPSRRRRSRARSSAPAATPGRPGASAPSSVCAPRRSPVAPAQSSGRSSPVAPRGAAAVARARSSFGTRRADVERRVADRVEQAHERLLAIAAHERDRGGPGALDEVARQTDHASPRPDEARVAVLEPLGARIRDARAGRGDPAGAGGCGGPRWRRGAARGPSPRREGESRDRRRPPSGCRRRIRRPARTRPAARGSWRSSRKAASSARVFA